MNLNGFSGINCCIKSGLAWRGRVTGTFPENSIFGYSQNRAGFLAMAGCDTLEAAEAACGDAEAYTTMMAELIMADTTIWPRVGPYLTS